MRKEEMTSSGYSLIEVLITISVIAIVSILAFPAYSNLMNSSRMATVSSTLHSSILYARSEAIKRGGNVVICKSSFTLTENPHCDGNASNDGIGWGVGWIIFHDVDKNHRYSSGDEILLSQGRLFERATDGAILLTPAREQIGFNSTGQVFGNYLRIHIRRPAHDNDLSHDRYLCMASGGRIRVSDQICRS